MSKYQKITDVIEAFCLTRQDGKSLAKWCGGSWIDLYGRGDNGEDISHILMETWEGVMRANIGDFIIKGVNGEFYPRKPDIFQKTYTFVS